MRTLVTAVTLLMAGVAVFTWASDGFRVATAEGVRRLAIAEHPVAVPGVTMEDMKGHVLHLSQIRDRIILVEFIYTTCPTICQDLGAGFAEIRESARKRGLEDRLRLLSISFDLENDTSERLQTYADHHGADGTVWNVVRPTSQQNLDALLKTFGVKVLPDPLFGFQHNVAIHVVDGGGKLVRIVDAEPAIALEALAEEINRL